MRLEFPHAPPNLQMLQRNTFPADLLGNEMKPIENFLKRLAERSECRKRERDHAYLAQSTDISDLERRMQELDRAKRLAPHWRGSSGA
jgi:Protein of unknown function (DUF3563)